MAIKTATKEIEGSTYFVTQHAALPSAKLFAKAVKAIGPALKGVGSMKSSDLSKLAKGDDKGVSESSMINLLSDIAQNIDEDKLEDLLKACLLSGNLRKDGKEVTNLDVAFDDFIVMVQVARFVLEVNFKDFLPRLIRLVK